MTIACRAVDANPSHSTTMNICERIQSKNLRTLVLMFLGEKFREDLTLLRYLKKKASKQRYSEKVKPAIYMNTKH